MADRFRVLVVEGNDGANTDKMRSLGASSYGEQYARLLESMSARVACDIARPSEEGFQHDLTGYAGVAWTGSAMSAYEDRAEVTNQIRLAERVFEAGLPMFGSCWGLQVAAVALGGKVWANPKGREIGFAERIEIRPGAETHPMLADRPKIYSALAVHRDEVEEVPDGAEVLASNGMSRVQVMVVERDGVDFWGVQYHPEFEFRTLAITYRRIARLLVKEGTCADEADAETAATRFDAYQVDAKELPAEVADAELRRLEIRNWLRHKVTKA